MTEDTKHEQQKPTPTPAPRPNEARSAAQVWLEEAKIVPVEDDEQ